MNLSATLSALSSRPALSRRLTSPPSPARPTAVRALGLAGAAALVLSGLTACSDESTSESASFGCYDAGTQGLTLVPVGDSCADGTVPVVWQTADGEDGATGPAGPAGEPGPSGEPGTPGETGPSGEAGPPGATGQAGKSGAAGTDGTTGAPGPAGLTGAPGPVGLTGATGPTGLPGASGPTGAPGADGATGAVGATGPAGPTGATGATGVAGPTGATGATGPAGTAAWESVSPWSETATYTAGPPSSIVTFNGGTYLAVESNVAQQPGTSTAWAQIAAPGIKGDKGDTGAAGPQGPVGAAGPQGPAGLTGTQGETGATGADGTPGAIGPQGPQGDVGPQGETGAVGATGPQGVPGVQGPTGATGPAGVSKLDPYFGPDFRQFASDGRTYECVMGEIGFTAATRVAPGLVADGRLMAISQNNALFALLGTTYGGDGRTTFALPDLRPVSPSNLTPWICDQGVFPSDR